MLVISPFLSVSIILVIIAFTLSNIINLIASIGSVNLLELISLVVEIFVPLTQWIIKSDNLRPFLILGEIQKSLEGKRINGLGKLSGGNFDLNFITDEIASYEMVFNITAYD